MSASDSSPYGQLPPAAILTPTDQTGVLLIVTSLCLGFGLVSLFVRGYVRVQFSRSYDLDDLAIGIAFIFSIFQSSAIYVSIKNGLGKALTTIDPSHLAPLQKSAYASDILYVISIWLTKCSMVFLFRRLSADKRHIFLLNLLSGGVLLLGVASIFVVALRCTLSRPWDFIDDHCTSQLAQWEAVAAFDIFTEALLAATPIFIIYGLQMPLNKKLAILVAFALRLLIVIPIVLRLHYILPALKSSDPTLRLEDTVINTQVEISWAIIAATIPCMRPFMAATHTTWGGHGETKAGSKYLKNSSSQPHSKSDKTKINTITSLRNIGNSISKQWPAKTKSEDIQLSRHTQNGWEIEVGERDNPDKADQRSLRSDESKQMMIRKDTEWMVHYEDRHEPAEGGSIDHHA